MNIKNPIKPLLVTPKPFVDESTMGFLLRTTEMNGYESPFTVLRYTGMNENQVRSARPPMDKVALLYGRPVEEFALLENSIGEEGCSKHWNVMGNNIAALYLNPKGARVCPECVIEHGHIENFWYLRHAIACPHHARMAISNCPNCGKKLSWNRPGLLTCSCGHDLSMERGEQIQDSSVLTMLNLLHAKLHGRLPSVSRLQQHGFPMQELESMSLNTLLGIIYRVQPKKQTHRCKHKVSVDVDANNSPQTLMMGLATAYGMLSGWPNGFYDYLESLPEHAVYSKSYNLQRQFHSFYGSFFKSGLPEEDTDFLRKAFVSFGNERWKDNGFIDIRIANRAKTERRAGGIAWLAKHLGVMPPTLMKYVREGLIKGKALKCGKRVRRIFNLDDIPFLPSSGKYYVQREAANFLGIPVSLLTKLKSDNTYKIVRLADGLHGYDELDLIEFRDSIINKAPVPSEYDPAKHITLGEMLRKKMKGSEIPARIIADIKHGKVQPCGRTGDQIRNIFLRREDVMAMMQIKLAA